ncbi:MAG TPA: isocitrate lyase/phosphoenolpyruvate mutase family protein [Ktedonobacterales bacterium]
MTDSAQQRGREMQRARAEQLRQWHQQPPILVLPNAWDAGSARVFERVGFRAVATTSSGVAVANGYHDGERMSRDLMVEAVGRIVAAVACPVTADIEAGYGDSVEAKLATIQRIVAVGAVGVNIEDSASDETGAPTLVDVAQQAALIRAIRTAANDDWGVPLVINARVDVYLHGEGDAEQRLAEAVRRAIAYREAGADCVFPIGLSDATTIGELVRAVGCPVNILAGPHTPTIPELAQLGVARVSVGGGFARVALGAARRAAEELLRQGTFTSMAQDALPGPDFWSLFAE